MYSNPLGPWEVVACCMAVLEEQEEDDKDGGLYTRLSWLLANDDNWQRDITLGRRIGFYKIKGELGSGNFSRVRLASHGLSQEKVAVKVIDKGKLDKKTTKMLLREISVMEACHHPHLVRLYEVIETSTRIHLVLQLAPGGELFIKLTEQGKYSEPRARQIFSQVASAISYMHDMGLIHRDLKAENVFFTGRDQVVVGDFGFATRLDSQEQQLNTFCGSPPYAAPELFVDDHYQGPAVDIWALGILLYFLVTGTMPFRAPTVSSLKAAILEGSFSLPPSLSPECGCLIQGILRREPRSRLAMAAVRDSAWLGGAVWRGEDRGYRPFPRLGADNLEDSEKAVLGQLEGLGITQQLLRRELVLGCRSSAIATYRILLHRALLGGEGPGRRSSPAGLAPTVSRPQSQHSHKSKACTLL